MSLSFTQKKNLQVRYEQYYSAVKFLDAESVTGAVEVPVIANEYGTIKVNSDDLIASVNQLILHKSNLVILNNLNDAVNQTTKYVNDRLDELAVVPKFLNKIASSNYDNIDIFTAELTAYLNDISGNFVDASNNFDDLSVVGEEFKFFGTNNTYDIYDLSGNPTPTVAPSADTFSNLNALFNALIGVTDWKDVSKIDIGDFDNLTLSSDYTAGAADFHLAATSLSAAINAGIAASNATAGDLQSLQSTQENITGLIDAISLDADSEEFYEEKQKLMRAIKRRVTVLDL